MPNERSNVIVNMEKEETFLNRTGQKEVPKTVSPWTTGHGPCYPPEPLNLHGYPNRPLRTRS